MDARRLGGNAIGGDLMELFGAELTVAWGVCGSCGAHEQLASLHVYRNAPGIVGRCAHCEAVLLRNRARPRPQKSRAVAADGCRSDASLIRRER